MVTVVTLGHRRATLIHDIAASVGKTGLTGYEGFAGPLTQPVRVSSQAAFE